MRITQGIIHKNFLRNLDGITNKINTKFQQISSGKRIVRPSDDPVAISRVIGLKDSVAYNKQYEKNIDNAIGWLKMTESALNNMENILNRLEEIAISTGSDNTSAEARKTSAEEVRRLKEHGLMIANTKFRGHYIFGGFLTDTPPFSNNDNDYHGDNNKMQIKANDGITIPYNTDGSIFTKDVNIFQLMDDIKDALNNNDAEAIRNTIDRIHNAFNNINIAHTEVGAKITNLDNIKEDLSQKELFINKIISEKEDTDMAEAIPKLYMYQLGYQSLLKSFARISSINLFDIIG